MRRTMPSFDLTDALNTLEEKDFSDCFAPLDGLDTVDTAPAYANPDIGPEYHDTYIDLFEPMPVEECHAEA